MKNTMIIGDTHELYCKKGYLEFCKQTEKKYKCGTVYHIGDLVDNHALSYFEHSPDGLSSGNEYKATLKKLYKWYKAFPKVSVCWGNHDRLPVRKAKTYGVSEHFIKDFKEVWQMPKKWDYQRCYYVGNTLIFHGKGGGSVCPHKVLAIKNMCNVVIGHHHTVGGADWHACDSKRVFGISTGCGIDRKTYAFDYQRDIQFKPILGCGVITDNEKDARFIPMDI